MAGSRPQFVALRETTTSHDAWTGTEKDSVQESGAPRCSDAKKRAAIVEDRAADQCS